MGENCTEVELGYGISLGNGVDYKTVSVQGQMLDRIESSGQACFIRSPCGASPCAAERHSTLKQAQQRPRAACVVKTPSPDRPFAAAKHWNGLHSQ